MRTLLNETNRTLETRTGDIDKLQNKFPEIETKIKALASKMREFDKSYNMEEVIDLLRNDIEQESEFFQNQCCSINTVSFRFRTMDPPCLLSLRHFPFGSAVQY